MMRQADKQGLLLGPFLETEMLSFCKAVPGDNSHSVRTHGKVWGVTMDREHNKVQRFVYSKAMLQIQDGPAPADFGWLNGTRIGPFGAMSVHSGNPVGKLHT